MILNPYMDYFMAPLRHPVRIRANGNFTVKFMSTSNKYYAKHFTWTFLYMDNILS